MLILDQIELKSPALWVSTYVFVEKHIWDVDERWKLTKGE